jgi:hypothetical protein
VQPFATTSSDGAVAGATAPMQAYDRGVDDRRAHKRHKVTMAVSIKGGSVAVIPAYMEDVSLGGALIRTSRPPPIDATVDVIVMRDDGPPLSMRARVRRAAVDSVGVQWFGLGEREGLFLLSLMRQG